MPKSVFFLAFLQFLWIKDKLNYKFAIKMYINCQFLLSNLRGQELLRDPYLHR